MEQIWVFFKENAAWIIPGIGLLIDIMPGKFRPVRWLLQLIGKYITADIKKDLKTLQDEQVALTVKITNLETTVDSNEMDRIRWEILGFANSIRNGVKHSKEEFDHIIALESKYVDLLEKTDTTNGVFEEEYKYILDIYHKCLRNNSFVT